MNKVCILNFSGRNNGNCQAISNFIKQYYDRFSNICALEHSMILDPCNHCDYECLQEHNVCTRKHEMDKIMEQLISSNMVYFIVPNYCGFPCANYFAFNERTVGYFNRDEQLLQKYYNIKKKFIIVSNTENETFYKAMEQQSTAPDILYVSSNKYGKRSIAGDLLESDDAREALRAFMAPLSNL